MYNNNQGAGLSTVVISKKHLERIQQSVQPKTEIKRACTKKCAERKQRIQRYEELRRQELSKLSEFQLEEAEKAKKTKERAKKIQNNEHEKVREMNSKMEYIKCVHIRDQQLKRKQEDEKILQAEEKEWHKILMKDRENHIESEKLKSEKRHQRIIEGAQFIREQIAEREHERMIEKEQVAKEAEIILEKMKKIEEEQKQKELQKEQLRKQMQAQIFHANEEAAEIKRIQEIKQKEEDDKIAAYLKQKCIREEEIERQKEEEHRKKEYEAAALRAKQEKIMDNRGQLDEIRARRYKEQKERAWRKAELEKAKKKKARDQELEKVRKQQLNLKKERVVAQIEQEKREYEITIQQLQKYEAQSQIERQKELEERDVYHRELINQIETKRAEQTRKQLLEHEVVKNSFEEERQTLLQIKQAKLEELRASGIPEKYFYDLQNVKI